MTIFYTEADNHEQSDLAWPRRIGNRWFNDPDDPHLQDRVYLFGVTPGRQNPDLAQLARDWRLPSGNAAAFALREAIVRREVTDEYALCLVGLEEAIEAVNDPDGYIPPAPAPPCRCGDHYCEECYPDGPPPCSCGEFHCLECHPEGPMEAGCNCRECRSIRDRGCRTGYDDQDDVDEWPGLPDIPPVPEGRCRFGIEIEFNEGNRYDIATQLLNRGIPCRERDYTHEIVRYWKMTTDSSVTGGELVSPILAGDDESIELTRECIRIVKANGGYTGRNVGMHVHLDVTSFRGNQLAVLARNLQAAEKPMASFVPEHRYRRNGEGYENPHGARLISASTWDQVVDWIIDIDPSTASRRSRGAYCPAQRYSSFNFQSLLTYGTIECRLLGHTLNTIKVRTWIRVLQTLIWASGQEVRLERGENFTDWLVANGLEREHADHFRSVSESRGNEHMLVAA